MGQLDGKVAIVTGATSGIGERIAEVFVAEGARVVAAGRREEEGAALAARCGPALSFLRADVTQEADVAALVAHAEATFGRLDCIVNNAGRGAPMTPIAEIPLEQYEAVFSVNVLGVLLGIKHAVPALKRAGGGSIITITSGAGLRGGTAGHVYGASKAAAAQLTFGAAAELGAHRIRANCIAPGGIVTGIFAKNYGVTGQDADRVLEVVEKRFASVQPLPRAGQTEDIARAAVYLASDGGSFVTGQNLVVDGGLVPFGTFGWAESVQLRMDLVEGIKAALGQG